MGYNKPTITDVVLTATKIHNGKIAPDGCVFFICKVKDYQMIYERAIIVKRSGMPILIEDQIKQKMKVDFISNVLQKINEPVKRTALKAQ